MAVEALRALASRVTDISVAASLVGSVRSVLDGSAEGKIKVTHSFAYNSLFICCCFFFPFFCVGCGRMLGCMKFALCCGCD